MHTSDPLPRGRQDSGVLPGTLPDAGLPTTSFIALSTSAVTDLCAAAFTSPDVYKYKSGSVITSNGMAACLNKFYRASHTCTTPAACGTWTLEA